MDKLVYTAATGLKALMAAQAVTANNMANVSTIGFRADRVVFDRVNLKGGGALETRSPTAEEVTASDTSPGAIQQTGRPLDVAVSGTDTWLAVQAPDGGEAYTRRGDLSVAPSGVLQTGDGHPVIGGSGPITVPPYASISVAGDGTISIVPEGGDAKSPQILDKLKLASTKGSLTSKGLDNLLYVQGGGALPEDAAGQVVGGALEGSNVNITQALVDMIQNQRNYEVQANLLKSAKDMDEGGASLMRLPS
ncbi:flagellar basal body rod protein FlgF [Sphingomonas sp. PB2P19]|uniref:flagellar basal body rod protein FlgF n=1 Tax=Sphingomonas rhamnosi TaxID=3096156 RepID=UPI002FC87C17